MSIAIRPAEPGDVAALTVLSAALGYPTESPEMADRLARLLALPGSDAVFVAVADQHVAGWIHVGRRELLESGARAEILGLVVDSAFRRRGVGRLLVDEAERWAARHGLPVVVVRSNVGRAESHPFYEECGYQRVKSQHVYHKAIDRRGTIASVLAVAALGVMLPLVNGCGAPRGATTAVIDTLAGGAVHVVNHAPAGWADTSGWKIVLVASHTFAADAPGSVEHPNYPGILPDGSMYVVSQVPQYLQRYDSAFAPAGRFGRRGSGPGEFESPEANTFGDSIAILDPYRSVLELFAPDGHVLQEDGVPTYTDWIGMPDHRGLLPLLGRYAAASDAGVMWWSFTQRRAVDSIIAPKGPPQGMWQSCHFVFPYQPELQLAATSSGAAWFGVTDRDHFVLTRTGRDTLRLVETDGRPRFPVDPKAVDDLLKPGGFVAKMCGSDVNRGEIPKQKPAWHDLEVDGRDDLWVERPAAYGASFDVYDSTGLWLGEVPSPMTGGENTYWHGDDILSVDELADGGYTLRHYRIDRRRPGRDGRR